MAQSEIRDRQEGVARLAEMIKEIQFAMMTTVMPDGSLRSRPMATQKTEFDGDLWFLTYRDSAKTSELEQDQHVNLAYANPDDNVYVSVSGMAQVMRDPAKIDELWSPAHRAWFPQGKEDPNIALIRVHVQYAEYWDTPSSAMVHLYGMAKAALTGKRADPGDDVKITLEPGHPGDVSTRSQKSGQANEPPNHAGPGKQHGDPLGHAAGID